MFEKINGVELTREEIELCREVYAKVSSSEDGARKLICANFEDGEETYAQIERGVDEFFSIMAAEMVSEDQIREILTSAMNDMSPVQQLRYLTNVLVAMSYTGSTLHNSDAWTECIEHCKVTLNAVESGEADETLAPLAKINSKLVDLVCAHIDDTAVLFVGQPQYEALMKACETSETDEVEMIAANTRQASIAAAASLWTLYAGGKLPSLKPQMDEDAPAYTPYMLGVITACTLEMDAAMKSGVWEKIKTFLLKAARAAVVLLVVGLGMYGTTLVGGYVATLIYQLTGLANVSTIIGIFTGIYGAFASIETLPEFGNTIFNTGVKVVKVSVSAIANGLRCMNDWIHNHIIPGAWALWNKCCTFVKTRIIDPIAMRLSNREGVLKTEVTEAETEVETEPLANTAAETDEAPPTVFA